MEHVYFKTSEYVSAGHPDKVMDSIAESLVDFFYSKDPRARIAIDGVVKGSVNLVGEITTGYCYTEDELDAVVRNAIFDCGYTRELSPDFNNEDVIINYDFTKQSPDIAQGVNSDEEDYGAGDQGIIFCGAIAESENLIAHSHQLAQDLSNSLFAATVIPNDYTDFRPDIKTQVTIKYVDTVPVAIDTVVVAMSHADKDIDEIREEVLEIAEPIVTYYGTLNNLDTENTKYIINGTGKFTVFGPGADSGEVGRKIVVDQTCGTFPVGGGNLNGKDVTKVDRSAVYMARYVSKNIVAAGLATKCAIELGYCIGVAEPVSLKVETYGTACFSEAAIEKAVRDLTSFRPGNIIKKFNLNKPETYTYKLLGMTGHIGYSYLPWEQIDATLMSELVKKTAEYDV